MSIQGIHFFYSIKYDVNCELIQFFFIKDDDQSLKYNIILEKSN